MDTRLFVAEEPCKRLDIFLAEQTDEFSRSRIKKLIEGGRVALNEEIYPEPQGERFNDQAPWKRIIVLIAGATMNYLLAVVLIIAVIGWWISTRNAFVRLKNKVEEAWATIDVFLKKRFDLIPNLVETVKGYAKHESETLQQVVAARNMSAGARTLDEKMEAANQMTGSLRTFLSAVAENYPDLKANTNFLDLQNL